jgi:DNA-binding NtrC family response regulator
MALEGDRLRRESKARHRKSIRNPEHPFLGTSAAIRKLEQLANRLLTSESPILIQGATGSGKGVLASWIHSNGTRSKEGFHNLNCAGLSQELLESELFGHRRGAFTGAVESKTGLLEVADHGTLFLDEIGDVDLTVQAKLLKVLEEQRFRRLGEVHERMVDIRLISATRWSLEKLIQDGAFREDLYYRINVVGITIPSLCERREDIPVLANHLLQDLCYECGRKPLELESSAIEALRRHPWPGNIRELRNVLERAAQFCDSGSLTANDLQFVSRTSPCASPSLTPENISGLTLRQMESVIIGAVLQEEGGSVERAARRLGIARSSLYNKMKVLAGRPAANA